MIDTQILKRKTIRATTWMYSANGINTLLNFGTMIVLARLLSPAAFGLLGMVTVFSNFLMLSSNLGLSVAIIQRQELDKRMLNSCYWLFIYIGLALGLIMFTLSKPIAAFYNQPELVQLVRFMAFMFLFASFGDLGQTLLKKELRFAIIAKIQVVMQIIYSITSISLALMGFGVMSLVLGLLVSALTGSILYLYFSSWIVGLPSHPRHAKPLIKFGLFVTGSNFTNYLAGNLDYLLIGKLLGSTQLGLYTLAYQLISMPLKKISRTIAITTYPAFAKIQDSDEQLKRGYNKLTANVAFITLPLLTLLLISADPLIPLLYGEKWRQCVPVVQIMCVAGALKSAFSVRGNIFFNKNRPEVAFYVQLIYLFLLAAGVVIGVRWGIVGVAAGVTTAVVINSYIYLNISNSLIKMRMAELVKIIAPAAVPSMLVSAFGLTVYFTIRHLFADEPVLMLVIILGGAVLLFVSIIYFFLKDFTIDIVKDVVSAFSGGTKGEESVS